MSMPPELNSKIDALLKEWAARRRAQTGPFELHPVTRKLLQAEAARACGTRQNVERSQPWWRASWLPWALSGGMAALVVGFVIWYGHQPARVEMARTMERVSQSAPANAPVPQAHDDFDLGVEPSERGDVASHSRRLKSASQPPTAASPVLAKGAKSSDQDSATVLAANSPATAVANKPVDLPTPTPASAPVLVSESSSSTAAVAAPVIMAKAAATPASPASQVEEKTGFSSLASNNGQDRQFAQQVNVGAIGDKRSENQAVQVPTGYANSSAVAYAAVFANNDGSNTSNASAVAKWQYAFQTSNLDLKNSENSNSERLLLANFTVQREGQTVRVTEPDGSVYEGQVVTVNDLNNRAFNSNWLSNGALVASERNTVQTESNAVSGAGSFAFRVSGSSKRLNKAVVFTGVVSSAQASQAQNSVQARSRIGGISGGRGGAGAGGSLGPVGGSRGENRASFNAAASNNANFDALMSISGQIQLSDTNIPVQAQSR